MPNNETNFSPEELHKQKAIIYWCSHGCSQLSALVI